MPRRLGDLTAAEREAVEAAIQAEAQRRGWHQLSHREKGELYRQWEERFELKHSAVKDQIMKGFDAAQHLPPSGEAAVHERVAALLESSAVPYWSDKVQSWSGRGVVDFVLGFSERWICVTAELESAVNWQEGLMQALWYRSAYFNETGLEALPCLILFGDVSRERWEEIKTTCLGQGVLLVTFDLRVQGEPAEHPLEELLSSGALFSLRSRA